ncbi:PREDICTED: putative UDP-rhamnose:rhamnosyltransferase 1 [Nelumbo nucifera]|uniref:UDP-rhamnose:rhamnosyltransferase 1 n=1 Tax=Nelumbo nucifera TaxID=4432 RepID=A0A1U8BKW5_NELNU|nr:PREDICTED: putative UDP-rhamnose:rhamnosyltransferase 1 [Nelumbo nucifera]
MENEKDNLHIVMFPWLAFGHMLPFLELSKCLAQRGHRISFVTSPRNIQRLPQIPPSLSHLINLVNLPLPPVDNLPENTEATIDLPYDKIQYLKKAFDGLEEPLTRFLEASSPDWVIYDFAPHWLPPITNKLGLLGACFNIFNAAAQVFIVSPSSMMGEEDPRSEAEHFTVPPKWIPFPSNLAFRLHEIRRIFDAVQENVAGVSDIFRFESTVRGSDIIAIRSCVEFEAQWLRLLNEEICRKPNVPVGLLPPSVQDIREGDDDESWIAIREWLDKQKSRSVVYIALGSEATLSHEDETELALGLELSRLPFFWVLRRPPGSSAAEELPTGFEDRTRSRGVVCRGWAPQMKILAHPSVGVFLTHCGWSSAIEALGWEVPLVLLPLTSTQGLCARQLAWDKIGVEIPRNEGDGSFTRNSVAETLRLVAVSEQGNALRTRAKEMRKIFCNSTLHDGYMDNFERHLKNHRLRNKLLKTD